MVRLTAVFGLLMLAVGPACGDAMNGDGGLAPGPQSPTGVPSQTPAGSERYVTVGFWNDSSCNGEPVSMNRFPVHYGDTQCYSWPGRSGTNSASRFSCSEDSFSYT